MDLLVELAQEAQAITLDEAQQRVNSRRPDFEPLLDLVENFQLETGTKEFLQDRDDIALLFDLSKKRVFFTPNRELNSVKAGAVVLWQPDLDLTAQIRTALKGPYKTVRQILKEIKADRDEVVPILEKMVEAKVARKRGRMYKLVKLNRYVFPSLDDWLADTIDFGTPDEVKILLDFGVEINPDHFLLAAQQNKVKIVELLLPDVSKEMIEFGMGEALLYGSIETYNFLEDQGYYLDDKDIAELLPTAAALGNLEVVQIIVEDFGIKPGPESLEQARLNKFKKIAEYLQEFIEET